MIGRCTHIVDCREASGMGKGGGKDDGTGKDA